jgi:hypothetical protein
MMSGPYRGRPRTAEALIKRLMVWFVKNPAASFETIEALSKKYGGGEDLPKRVKRAA